MLHSDLLSCARTFVRSAVLLLDVLVAPTPEDADREMDRVRITIDSANSALWNNGPIILAGKELRYGCNRDVPDVIAEQAATVPTINDWLQSGLHYFHDAFVRDSTEVFNGGGLLLAGMAVLAESFDDPSKIRATSSVVAEVMRDADTTDRPLLLGAMRRINDDIIAAFRHIYNVALEVQSMDMSMLMPHQRLGPWLRVYHRLAESGFNTLLSTLLYCERIVDHSSPDYDEISKRNFGVKINKNNKGIAASTYPKIVALADDLLMFLRHADAHCDFRTEEGKVIVNERRPDKSIIKQHEFSEGEFIQATQRLLEAVLGVATGILIFEIENHETYLIDDRDTLLDCERAEVWKLFFAVQGIVAENIDHVPAKGKRHDLSITVRFAKGTTQNIGGIVTALIPVASLYPRANNMIVRLTDGRSALVGIAKVPTRLLVEYGRVENTSTIKRLALASMMYRILSTHSHPVGLFMETASADRLWWKLLMPFVMRCINKAIIEGYYKLEWRTRARMLKDINPLQKESEAVGMVLKACDVPQKFKREHSLAVEVVNGGLRFAREVRRISRKKRGTPDMDELKQHLEPTRQAIIEIFDVLTRVARSSTDDGAFKRSVWGRLAGSDGDDSIRGATPCSTL